MAQQIKIIAIPPGQAPEWVRKEWIDIILPIAENTPGFAIETGVLGGRPENTGGYSIETTIAIQALKDKGAVEAAEWWEEHINPERMPWLVFKRDVCQFV